MKSERASIRQAMTHYESVVLNLMSNNMFLCITGQVCHHVEDQVSRRVRTLVYPAFLGERHTLMYPLLTQVRQSLVDYVQN